MGEIVVIAKLDTIREKYLIFEIIGRLFYNNRLPYACGRPQRRLLLEIAAVMPGQPPPTTWGLLTDRNRHGNAHLVRADRLGVSDIDAADTRRWTAT